MMIIAVPLEVAEQFDEDLFTFIDDPQLDEDDAKQSESQVIKKPRPSTLGATIPRDDPPSDDVPVVKVMVPLNPPEPMLFTQDALRGLGERAVKRARERPFARIATADRSRRAVPARGHPLGPGPDWIGRRSGLARSAPGKTDRDPPPPRSPAGALPREQ